MAATVNDLRLKKNANKRKAAKKEKAACWKNLNGRRYVDDILATQVVPYMSKHKKVKIFMHDNAPAHGKGAAASLAAQYLAKKKIKVMKWPANSPDFNPIELVWKWIKGKVAGKILRTREEIIKEYTYWWKKLPLETYRRWCEKLPELMKETKKSHGWAQFK